MGRYFVLLLLLAVEGCSSSITDSASLGAFTLPEAGDEIRWAIEQPKIPVIEEGMTTTELAETLRSAFPSQRSARERYYPPQHLFTLQRDGQVLIGMRTRVHPKSSKYHFIFVDGLLRWIARPLVPSYRVSQRPDGTSMAEPVQRSRAETITEILEQPHVPVEQLAKLAATEVSSREADLRRRAREYNPIFIPLSGLVPSQDRSYQKHLQLMNRYDATRLTLGMKEDQVEALMGVAVDVSKDGAGQERRIYGEAADLGVMSVPRIEVTYEEGRAKAIHTHYSTGIDVPPAEN